MCVCARTNDLLEKLFGFFKQMRFTEESGKKAKKAKKAGKVFWRNFKK
jgi:hypothetical protein